MKPNIFHNLAQAFLKDLFDDLSYHKVLLRTHWDIDHICYRADSLENYESLKNSFSEMGELLIESEVNGRLISTYKLHKPVFYEQWRIDLVELPAPKKGKITQEGLEHIEVVIDQPFSELMAQYAHLPLETKGFEKDYNQELEINFGQRNIKFHHSSLASVINLEKNERVWKVLQKSKVLKVLRVHKPLVAGTFPLGVYTENSDIDVLVEIQDHETLEKILKSHFESFDEFEMIRTMVDDLETTICSFSIDGVAFEIFGQDRNPVSQKAYRHFQVEEQLLKYGGEDFLRKVQDLRSKGEKTEPAFAKALELEGDPYHALLNQNVKDLINGKGRFL